MVLLVAPHCECYHSFHPKTHFNRNAISSVLSFKSSHTHAKSTFFEQQERNIGTFRYSSHLSAFPTSASALTAAASSTTSSTLTTPKARAQWSDVFKSGRNFIYSSLLGLGIVRHAKAGRGAAATTGVVVAVNSDLFKGVVLWALLFTATSALHTAELAFTKISPWKLKEFAEDEGESSPFAALSRNDHKMHTAVVLATTALSTYSTALFVALLSDIFPNLSLGYISASLAGVTLLFGELVPKALAMSNPEFVVRKCAKPISYLAGLLQPLSAIITLFSNVVLKMFGLRSEEEHISEDMLRMMVAEAARDPKLGIESREGRMIEGVLDLQELEVSKIMRPRIEIAALPVTASAKELLELAKATKYSRVPLYEGDIDNIKGVVFTKDLLSFITLSDARSSPSSWTSIKARDLMVPTYFIPETMSTWTALQELRRRSKHMAIVVDEYGGTSGLVTFEDILEEVVGEIYDEDDAIDRKEDMQDIWKDENGIFTIKGDADVDDVVEALGLVITDEQHDEYSTMGGLLTGIAGEIPKLGGKYVVGGCCFTATVVDDRRVLSVTAEGAEGLPEGKFVGNWGQYKHERDEARKRKQLEEKSGDIAANRDVQLEEKLEGSNKSSNNKDSSYSNSTAGDSEDAEDKDNGNGNRNDTEGSVLSFNDGEWVPADVGLSTD